MLAARRAEQQNSGPVGMRQSMLAARWVTWQDLELVLGRPRMVTVC
jgi:hypothetical protein